MKNTNVLELISNLEYIVSANDDVIKNCEISIQTVFNNGTSQESYVETRVQLCNNQKNKELNVPSSRSSSSKLSVVLLIAVYR